MPISVSTNAPTNLLCQSIFYVIRKQNVILETLEVRPFAPLDSTIQNITTRLVVKRREQKNPCVIWDKNVISENTRVSTFYTSG